jgi:hypothetical protein
MDRREGDMESEEPFEALTPRRQRRLVAEAVLRALATVVLLGTLYFVLPLDRGGAVATLAVIAGGCALLAVVGWQIRRIARSEYPNLRAAEALAFTLPVFVILFATTYFLMAHVCLTLLGT